MESIKSLIDLNNRILTPKLSEYWEQSKETTNYVGSLPSCVTVKNDAIIIRSQNIGQVYDLLSPALLLTWLQGTGYVTDWKDRYILIKKDRTTQPLTESQRNHNFTTLACFWQQYSALKQCEFPEVRVIPDTDDKIIKLVGPSEILEKVRQFLNGTMRSAKRAEYCDFLGRHDLPKSAIETQADDYTDRNSTLTYTPHTQLITELSQSRVMRDRQQCRIVVEHPVDPEGNVGKTQSMAGSTMRACLERDFNGKTVKDFGLYIKNEKWDIIKGSRKKGELRLMLPEIITASQPDSVIEDDFELV